MLGELLGELVHKARTYRSIIQPDEIELKTGQDSCQNDDSFGFPAQFIGLDLYSSTNNRYRFVGIDE